MSKLKHQSEFIEYLSGFITKERFHLFEKILKNRTRYITVVLEDIYQPHNASAVLRTCDCFGIQDVHIIENQNKYQINPDVALGSSKWLNLIKHSKAGNNTLNTINDLRNKGYRIVATTPHKNDIDLEDFDVEKGRTALFFGTELNGLSSIMLENADEYLKIPMFGFTESFNISVSAAIILHKLSSIIRNSSVVWKLSDHEKQEILITWIKSSLKKPEMIEKHFREKKNNQH